MHITYNIIYNILL